MRTVLRGSGDELSAAWEDEDVPASGMDVCACTRSCLALWGLMDGSPSGSPVHGFSSQEYWSGLPFPTPGDLPDLGIKTWSLASPTLAGRFFTTGATREAC